MRQNGNLSSRWSLCDTFRATVSLRCFCTSGISYDVLSVASFWQTPSSPRMTTRFYSEPPSPRAASGKVFGWGYEIGTLGIQAYSGDVADSPDFFPVARQLPTPPGKRASKIFTSHRVGVVLFTDQTIGFYGECDLFCLSATYSGDTFFTPVTGLFVANPMSPDPIVDISLATRSPWTDAKYAVPQFLTVWLSCSNFSWFLLQVLCLILHRIWSPLGIRLQQQLAVL